MARKKQLLTEIDMLLERMGKLRARLCAAPDEEALHDLRVALRGLRTLLPLLLAKRDPLHQSLKMAWRKLFKLTSPLRDTEVMLQTLPADHPMTSQLQQRQQGAYRALVAGLSSITWPVLDAASRAQLALSIDSTRRKRIRQRMRRRAARAENELRTLLHDGGKDGKEADHEAWHPLRIKIKRLRYLIEYAGPWLAAPTRKQLAPLKATQGAIGDWHDLIVRQQAGIVLPQDAGRLPELEQKVKRTQRKLRNALD
ncbi:hypothetical protein IGB42_00011 [Andreprevotia sp. IGB-42]|uniref:CHAD domain-containing protein n=1 Tax=Andreprevotia sp. IGB-42 TaxID=2497473 RepID=UPI00135950CC|nr:CHAD domain-containing protein [Andreprevotia sp. IGB-42]KAF0814935.1 hypothetical protein IGB42_00011 [Andreprevotia sp. IGB-42]